MRYLKKEPPVTLIFFEIRRVFKIKKLPYLNEENMFYKHMDRYVLMR